MKVNVIGWGFGEIVGQIELISLKGKVGLTKEGEEVKVSLPDNPLSRKISDIPFVNIAFDSKAQPLGLETPTGGHTEKSNFN